MTHKSNCGLKKLFNKKMGARGPPFLELRNAPHGDTAVIATVATLLLSTLPSLTTKVKT